MLRDKGFEIKTGLGGLDTAFSVSWGSGSPVTIVNALAICSGMICDGAKPSCAAKISMAVEAGIIGYEMYVREKQFINGEGIVKSNVERTIAAVGDVAHNGMHDTDNRILKIMLED